MKSYIEVVHGPDSSGIRVTLDKGTSFNVVFSITDDEAFELAAHMMDKAEVEFFSEDVDGVEYLNVGFKFMGADGEVKHAVLGAFSGEMRPVVVGAGPAGLVAAWRLAEAGARPILIERGAPVEKRKISAARFWADGVLDPEDNVLFGEGGAGLFSDGKLTTRSKLRSSLPAA